MKRKNFSLHFGCDFVIIKAKDTISLGKEKEMERENSNLEYKEIVTNTFLKTVSAFANYGTGKIVFGVTDDMTIKGLKEPKIDSLSIENRINDSITPVPDYTLEIDEKNKIIVLTVREGRYKPYFYKGKAYKRSDTATIEIGRLELTRLILEGQNLDYESLPAHTQQLSFNLLEKKLIEILHIEKLNKDIMKTLDLYSDREGYNRTAELLADKNDFPGITIIRFGNSVDEIMDHESTEHVSALEMYGKAVSMYKKYYQYEKIDGVMRKTVETVPEKAFREAVANSIVHRMWDMNSAISVSMFANRIEITSPGGLPSDITEDEFLHSQISVLRNPRLGNIFYRLRYIERFGTGILRIRHAYEKSYRKPDFYVFQNSIKIVLPVLQYETDTVDEQKLMDVLNAGELLTRTEIEILTGFDKTRALRVINRLLAKNMLDKIGQGRGTRYKVKI